MSVSLSTGDPFLDAMGLESGKLTGSQEAGFDTTSWLLQALVEFSEDDRGLVLSIAVVPIPSSTILFANSQFLDFLDYQDKDAFAAAVTDPRFIHPEDLRVAEQHVAHGSSATYDARFARELVPGQAEDPEYRGLRVQGLTLSLLQRRYRITMFWLS